MDNSKCSNKQKGLKETLGFFLSYTLPETNILGPKNDAFPSSESPNFQGPFLFKCYNCKFQGPG